MEGTGSFGRQAAAHLTGAGYRVVEALTPVRGKGRATSDDLDAQRAARDLLCLPVDRLRDHRAGAVAGALQVLTSARDRLSVDRTATVNALTGLLRAHDLGKGARAEAVRLASRITDLDQQLKDNEKTLRELVVEHAPDLLDEPGIGPYCAPVILAAWSHPGRVRSEAAFARLAGTTREIRRQIKRYLTRKIFRLLTRTDALAASA